MFPWDCWGLGPGDSFRGTAARLMHRRLDSLRDWHRLTQDSDDDSDKMVHLKLLLNSIFFCSLVWLFLFTSNSDAVHPSAVYRSFHQNDHFTVPFPNSTGNSTLSPKCQASFDKLRNSTIAESMACKFIHSIVSSIVSIPSTNYVHSLCISSLVVNSS